MATDVKTLEIDGVRVPITLNGKGDFEAMVDGQEIQSPTLKALEEKIKKAVRSAGKLAIEATLLQFGWRHDTPEFEDIVITGKHAGNDNPLYRSSEGHVEQMRETRECMRRLTKDEKKEFGELVKVRDRAEKAIVKWKDDHRMNPHQAIRRARGDKDDE